MEHIAFTNLLLFVALIASAQSVETKYYNKHHEEVTGEEGDGVRNYYAELPD